MFQRKPDRKQLHQVDTNSAFFTSHGQGAAVPPQGPKSPIEVGSGMPPIPPRPSGMGRRRSSASSRVGGGGGGICGGNVICCLLTYIVWTVVVFGCSVYYYENIVIPKAQERIHEEAKRKSDKKINYLKDKSTGLEKDLAEQKQRLDTKEKETQNMQIDHQRQVDQLNHDVEFYKATAEQMKQKLDSGAISSGDVQQMQGIIQAISRRVLVEK